MSVDYRPKLAREGPVSQTKLDESPFSSAYALVISVLNQQLIKFNSLMLTRIATDSVVRFFFFWILGKSVKNFGECVSRKTNVH